MDVNVNLQNEATTQHQPNLRQRILVADDDPAIRRLNSEALLRSGYQVDAVENGADAWEAVQLKNYDLMVTDYKMPKMTGVELIKKLHAAKLTLPVIMATGTMPTWEFALHPWIQPAAMLLKPYTFEELLETVKNVLHANADARREIAPPPNWQGQPLPNGLRL